MENPQEKIASLEALLFIHGESLMLKKIEKILQISGEDLTELVKMLEERLADESRGLTIVIHEDKIQLATKPAHKGLLEAFMKEELTEDLTPATLETLAVVAYLGPISRSKIEFVRGVNSSFTLRNLRLRGLVDRHSDPEHPNIFLYETSFDLLKHLGLSRQTELPEFSKFSKILEPKPETAPEAATPSFESPQEERTQSEPGAADEPQA